jgi:HK97 family phage major capsid protein
VRGTSGAVCKVDSLSTGNRRSARPTAAKIQPATAGRAYGLEKEKQMRVSLSNKSIQQIVNALSGAEDNAPSVGAIIRGLAAASGKPLTKNTAEDLAVVKALQTGSGAGSYLVPTEQYSQLVPALSRGGVLRRAGATIVPLTYGQKVQIPVEGAVSDSETVYINENSQLSSPITPNIEQRDVTLKQLAAIFEASSNLARTSKPGFDLICSQIMSRKIARGEDFSFFAGKANGPISLLNRANTQIVNQTFSSLGAGDIDSLMEAADASEGQIENFAFFTSPVGLQKLRSLRDTAGLPILKVDLADDGTTAVYQLRGHRLYTTPAIPNHVGSGAQTTYIAFFDPANVMICDGGIELAIADDGIYFDRAAVAVRVIAHREFALAHPEAVAILENVI